ncbi:E3 binding domain-containing protein, partial [Achromobacter deleyi]
MATLIKLPSVAADTDGGTLHQWLKQEGDSVAVGDALAEIETEKAIVEINAEQAGVLGRIVVQAGAASVPINTVIGVLLAPGEGAADIDRALAESGAAAGGAGTPAQASEAGKAGASTGASTSAAAAPVAEAAAASASSSAGRTSAVASTATASRSATPGARVFASPLARRLAAQWHVDLLAVNGTGPHGRIVRRDVEAARDQAPAAIAQ